MRDAARLMQALGMAGDAIEQIGRNAAIKRREREIEDQRAIQYDQGQAAQDFAENSPIWDDWIASRKIVLPDGIKGDDIPEFARSLATQFMPEGMSQAYQDEFLRRAGPRLVSRLTAQEAANRAETHAALRQNQLDRVAGEIEAARLSESADVLVRDTQMHPDEAKAEIGLHAMKSAVVFASDDPIRARKALDAAAAYLGDSHKAEQAVYRAQFEQEASRVEKRKHEAVIEHIERRFEQGHALHAIEKELNRISTVGALPARNLSQFRARIAQQRDEMEREALRIQSEQERQELESEYRSLARNMANHPEYPLYLLPEMEHTLPNGQTVSLNKSRIMQETIDLEVSRIAAIHADEPAIAFAKQVQLVGRNAIVPSEWESRLNKAGIQASVGELIRAVTDPATGRGAFEAAEIPTPLVASVQMYMAIHAENPQVARIAMKDSGVEELYDMIAFAATLPEHRPEQRDDGTIDYGKAVVASVRALDARGSGGSRLADSAPMDELRNAASTLGGNNSFYVEERLSLTARFYRSLHGVSWERAMSQAVETFEQTHAKLNQNWINLHGSSLPVEGLSMATEIIARQYARTATDRGTDDGVRDRDLALIPDGRNHWRLVNARAFNRDVEQPNIAGLSAFTTAELHEIIRGANERSAEQNAKLLEKIRQENAARTQARRADRLRKLAIDLNLPRDRFFGTGIGDDE